METRIFYSHLIEHTQFVHIPDKQMQNRACVLMKLHNNRSSVGEKHWSRKNKMIWRCIYGIPITPFPRQQGLVQTERKVDNYRPWYICSSVLKEEGYLQEIKWYVNPCMCLVLNGIWGLKHSPFHFMYSLLISSSQPDLHTSPAPAHPTSLRIIGLDSAGLAFNCSQWLFLGDTAEKENHGNGKENTLSWRLIEKDLFPSRKSLSERVSSDFGFILLSMDIKCSSSEKHPGKSRDTA